MVIETISDLIEDESRIGANTARCLNCGNFEDRRIHINRANSRVSIYVDPHTVGNRSLSVIQLRALERATQTDGVIAKSPRGRTLEPAHNEQPSPLVKSQRRYA